MWSPQLYIKTGLEEGRDRSLLENAVNQSNKVIFSSPNIPSILSLNHLAKRTGIDYMLLRSFVDRSAVGFYRKFSIRKRSGGRRFIYVPSPQLMRVQKWLNEHVLKGIPVHPASHAFKIGCSTMACASKHCGAKWLIKVDVTDFFESISEIQVFRIFRDLGYQPLVAFELARLCTIPSSWRGPRKLFNQWHVRETNKNIPSYNQALLGYLPQGAATSPLVSNLVMKDCDVKLESLAHTHSLLYTRYSDDLTFSTRSKSFSRFEAKKFIFEVYKILSESGYKPQLRKTKIIPPGSKKIVLGLNVDGDLPRLQKEYKDRIRQHLYFLKKNGISEHVNNRGFDSIWGFKSHLKGMIDYAKMVEPDYAQKVFAQFSHIDWPV